MRRTAVVLAALAVLAGCGTDTTATSGQQGSASSAPAASGDEDQPSEHKAGHKAGDKSEHKAGRKPGDKSEHEAGHTSGHKPAKGSASASVPADAPACSAVWVDGTTLARDYEGCLAGQRFVGPDEESCSFGQRLVRFSDHFYAVRGGPVNRTAAPLTKDRVYRGALASCRG